jgi:hypothetical protein
MPLERHVFLGIISINKMQDLKRKWAKVLSYQKTASFMRCSCFKEFTSSLGLLQSFLNIPIESD